jgi:polysaccharide export outer membrane protein
MMNATRRVALVFSAVTTLWTSVPVVAAQTQAVPKPQVAESRTSTSDAAIPGATPAPAGATPASAGATLPAGYLIGPDDVLSIVFWRDKDMSAEVVVRPDGRISLPLLNDIQAAGSTPEELRAQLEKAAAKYIAEPNATVVVKTINSRKVYITGNVLKPGTYPLTGDMSVLQLIAVAGGLQEYADSKKIVVMRKEDGRDRFFSFNYKDVTRQKNLQQNIALKPGDTVVVP